MSLFMLRVAIWALMFHIELYKTAKRGCHKVYILDQNDKLSE